MTNWINGKRAPKYSGGVKLTPSELKARELRARARQARNRKIEAAAAKRLEEIKRDPLLWTIASAIEIAATSETDWARSVRLARGAIKKLKNLGYDL